MSELKDYIANPADYKKRLAAMRVIQALVKADDYLGDNYMTYVIQKAAIAEAVASNIAGQGVNMAVITERSMPVFNRVLGEVKAMVGE